jgi:putative transcription factor
MPKLFHHKAPFGEEQEIVDNYNILIRKAREQSGLKMEVVAERISEKTSYLESIEHGKLIPTIQVARKLEKELGIKLVETVHEEVISSTTQQKTKFSGATLGDAIPTHKKRKS